VGTTDVEWDGPPGQPTITEGEIDYLLSVVRRYFAAGVSADDVVWSYSGVRALVDDGASNPSRITRDYILDLDTPGGGAPLLSVIGGKITTYRRLAEEALDRLAPFLRPASSAWTDGAVLPGGDIPDVNANRYAQVLAEMWPGLPQELLSRLAGTYGTRTERLLERVRSLDDLGERFGAGLYRREVDYLVSHEWARSAEDVLFRRTKLGLHIGRAAAERLDEYVGEHIRHIS